ncbi:MAG TPA: lipoyl synthase [Clostridiales bacterium]|jgi:lipoic acid synthetase|nr:lipoyl synthase [Clostridiales bacterium]
MTTMRKPEWLKRKIDPVAEAQMTALLRSLSLHTVCEDANCPNRSECFKSKTATFMILGDVCTRGCRYCAVTKGAPLPLDTDEPQRIAAAAETLGLRHVVITSVTRDDLPDGGAAHFTSTIEAIRSRLPQSTIEVLIPDFCGSESALQAVIDARPDILNHNVETVPALYPTVRPQASFARSLELLRRVKHAGLHSKTGFMVGLGETREEVLSLMDALIGVGCDMLTIGQYLQPSREHLPVSAFITPAQFEEYRQIALEKGFRFVASGPLVRSSYHAAEGMAQMEVSL